MIRVFAVFCCLLLSQLLSAQPVTTRCSNNPARSWWDVQQYDLHVRFDTASTAIQGNCTVTATIAGRACDSLQIDLDSTFVIDSILLGGNRLSYGRREGSCFVRAPFSHMEKGDSLVLDIWYHGVVREALNAPWDGGMVRRYDSSGNIWMAVACQGEGASTWFPCKNFQGDEPGRVTVSYTVPDGLSAIGNGRLQDVHVSPETHTRTWTWLVTAPINNYDITFYIGKYDHWSDSLQGKKGWLSLDYYVLPEHKVAARKQFEVVKPMLQCFEEKIGPYPFYEDGYKLVEAPYLGMEHQSAVAYGNGFQMGYRGLDRSKTGAGLDFDFIIIHESGHEWFGNSITAYDKADTWIHEGFTTYAETIFEECLKGRDRAFLYQQGKKGIVRNDRPVQGQFDQCDEGSADHYDKAACMIHMIRMIIDNDSLFFAMLRGMNHQFYHRIVTGMEVEAFISSYSGKDFSRLFDQYLRRGALPQLEIRKKKGLLSYRWVNCTPDFDMPLRIITGKKETWIRPLETWSTSAWNGGKIKIDPNFLLKADIR